MTMTEAQTAASTQTDRILAVLMAGAYMAGILYLLEDDGMTDKQLAYYVGGGGLVILPTVIYLLSRVLSFKGIADKLEEMKTMVATTNAHAQTIETQTNGNLTARLDAQTTAIVESVTHRVTQALLDAGYNMTRPAVETAPSHALVE